MVKKLVLFDKIYNISSQKNKEDVFVRYLKYLKEHIKNFSNTNVKIKKLRDFDKRFEIFIDGPEEIFVFNLLKKEIGYINEFKDIEVGKVYKGTMIDVGKVGFGIFVDCAILNPKTDVLLTLRSLKYQLANAKDFKNVSLKDIIKTYDFIDHFPVYVKIVEFFKDKNKIQGELDEKSIKVFKKIINENIEGIFASGATKNQFKKALIRNGHFRDIITIKRFGFLENIVLLKEGTNAPGIIAHIGKNLRNCKLSAIRSKRIKKLLV
ncbi:MAG: DUF2110 family protein [Promethearchaeota archaeon]